MKILVVDDSSLVRSLVTRMVSDLGHECASAEDAATGFAVYTDFEPDMILSDWTMPGQSGIDFCRRVRESDGRYTYFAMLTSMGGSERLVAAMEAGADDFLVKPLQDDRLEASLLAARRITSLHARLAESEARSRELAEEQGAVVRIASAVAGGADPEVVFSEVAAEAARLTGASAGSLWRFTGTDATLSGTWGDESVPLGTTVTPRFEGVLGQVLGYGLSMRVDGECEVDGAEPRSAVGAPVYLLGEVWGAVLASRPVESPLNDQAQDRVARFSEYVAVAVANAEVRRRVEAQAVTDPLTQISNRRGFQERLAAETSRSLRHRRALSVVIFDVDHFKRINDTYGHPAGDRVLVEVSRRIAGQIREGELIARVGGEEFAWILPEADSSGALAAAERARNAVCAEPIDGVGAVTVSAGVADIESAEWVSDNLFRNADRALYAAKSQGRNRCVVAGSEDTPRPSPTDGPKADRMSAYSGLRSLAEAVDLRGAHAWRHHERVAEVAVELAATLGWNTDQVGRIRQAALVHDVGFAAAAVGPASSDDHAELGANMAACALDPEQIDWIAHHHSRVDAFAHPDDLSEGARILAVAEALDMLVCHSETGPTQYRDDALAALSALAGKAYCPRVIAALAGGSPPAPTGQKARAAA